MSWSGKNAVITGASSGIGRALALGLARDRVGLYLLGRNRERLEDTAKATREWATHVVVQPLDLTSDESVLAVAEDVRKKLDGVDILIHSMGRFSMGSWQELPAQELDELYGANLRAPYLLTKALLEALEERQGDIVFLNSSIVQGARGQVGAYAASKFGLLAFADSLREEVNGLGVRVLSVYPGRTATPMQEEIFRQEGRSWTPNRLLQPEDVAETVLAALRLPRTAEVTDIHIRPMQKV